MSNRDSLGPIQITGVSVFELNDALQQVMERIDALKGLRGRGMIYDRVRVDDPTVASDAMTLGTFDDSTTVFVTKTTTQTISGLKTFTATVTLNAASLRYTDSNGTVLHCFGSST